MINPFSYLVVFGGGSPDLVDVNWQTASSGGLSLNNGGDVLSLFSATSLLIDEVTYDVLANQDESIIKNDNGDFVLHSSVSDELYSPGKGMQTTAIPEPLTIISFMGGMVGVLARRWLTYA